MPNMKTKRAAMKRFRLTGSGKIKRGPGQQAPHPDQEVPQAEEPAGQAGARELGGLPRTLRLLQA
jgi:hypothetical protein